MEIKIKELYKDKVYWQNLAADLQERLKIVEGVREEYGYPGYHPVGGNLYGYATGYGQPQGYGSTKVLVGASLTVGAGTGNDGYELYQSNK